MYNHERLFLKTIKIKKKYNHILNLKSPKTKTSIDYKVTEY